MIAQAEMSIIHKLIIQDRVKPKKTHKYSVQSLRLKSCLKGDWENWIKIQMHVMWLLD